MEGAREIYWNMGSGVIVPMYLFALIAIAVCAWGFYLRIRVYRLGRPVDRFDRIPLRIRMMLKGIISQRKVLREPYAGLLHSLFFWGFGLLLIGTLLILVQGDLTYPIFHLRFLEGEFYRLFSLLLDIGGGVAIVMLTGLLVRRFFIMPAGLETVRDDYLIHTLLFAILITGFLVEGARMASTEIGIDPGLARFSPIGLGVGRLFLPLSPDRLSLVHRILWWLHFFLAMGFICALPFTRLRHICTIPANYLLTDLGPKGAIASIDLEDEGISQYGAARVSDLAWKDIFDTDACTSCKRCQDQCPAWKTGKPLSPMKVIRQIGEAAFYNPVTGLAALVGEDAVWSCTTCRSCEEACPADIGHVNKIIELRRNLILMEGKFPGDAVRTAFGNLEVNANPFGLAHAGRGDWVEGLDISLMAIDSDVEVLYFAGCYASFDRRNREVARSFVKICNAADVKVGILGKEEKCCGEPPRKLGNEYLYQMTARQNIEVLKGYGVKRIVTTCPHCFNTLGRDYRDLGLDIPVEHYTTFIAGLLSGGRLKLEPTPFDFTYHDSCYLGRYMDIIAAPRQVMEQAGGRLTEMKKSGYGSFCCGAGGGRILAEEKLGSRINGLRVNMAKETGAPLLVSSCPFCLTMFEDGIKTGGSEGELAVKDLAEMVVERIIMKDER
jgi:Fe-S oxidoreductase/nitrate reductase gamma subunit